MFDAYTIVNKLYEGLSLVRKDLTDIQTEHVEEFIDHGEWGLAVETLCDFIHENNLRISLHTYELLKEIGSTLDVSPSNWEMLKQLVEN